MITFTVLFGLICLARGQNLCCTVPAWEAIEGFMVGSTHAGQSTVTEGDSLVSYDKGRMMINSFIEQTSGGMETKYRILQDYRNKLMYRIDEHGCSKSAITTPIEPSCVPAGSVKITRYYYGPASRPLPVDVYKLPESLGQTGYLTVTSAECIPVGVGLFGNVGDSSHMTSMSFSNFTVGIKNSTVFDIPPECKNTSTMHEAFICERNRCDALRRTKLPTCTALSAT